MNKYIVLVCVSVVLMFGVLGLSIQEVNTRSADDWIDSRIETGQDRFGNCYLYIKPWQWVDRVECDRIGKAVDKFGNSL
jgi:hypothetical protein